MRNPIQVNLLYIFICTLLLMSCKTNFQSNENEQIESIVSEEYDASFLTEWIELLYHHIANEKIKPPVASRMYGYLGVTMYQSALGGMPDYKSLAGQLNGLTTLTEADSDKVYDWRVVVIEAMFRVTDEMLKDYIAISESSIVDLRDRQIKLLRTETEASVMDNSMSYARVLGDELVQWILADNYDKTRKLFYKTPSRLEHPEFWAPTDFNHVACEPYWPDLRTFAIDHSNVCPIELPHPFSTDTSSEFYRQVIEVLEIDANLTEEQRQIALFWADDPGETATPPGHWAFIASQVIEERDMNLHDAVEIYSLLGIAIADAFIQCWHTKYEVNLVRPVTFIKEFLGMDYWEPLLDTPPFPEYASGHSAVTGAAATVLTDLMGDNIAFMDSTHLRIGLAPRYFESFWEAAEEAAYSRLYGGIHYKMAVVDGLEQGKCVGREVLNNLKLK